MILIGTDDGIYRWFEGCGWPIFHSLQDRSVIALAAPGRGVLAAVDRGGDLLESVDNGQTWRQIPLTDAAGTPTALAIGGTPAAIVLASRPLALYRRPVGAPIPRVEIPAPASKGLASNVIGRARTIAGGATTLLTPKRASASPTPGWSRLSAPSVASTGPAPEIRALVQGSGSPQPWYAAVRGASLWRSLDLGQTWQACPGLPAEVLAVRTAPERPRSVYAATADGCWISADGGQTWEDRSGGLEQARYLSAIEVKPGAPDVLLAGAAARGPGAAGTAASDRLDFSLYESTNGGKAWSLVRRGNPDVLERDVIADIRHDPAAPDNVIMALASGELWVTRNGGAYWGPLARQIRAARVLCAVA